MKLEQLAKELESAANHNGIEIYIDDTALSHSFIPIVKEDGQIGAIGQYKEKNKVKIGYFLLNNSIVKYALNEGFEKDDIFDCFKKSIFKELNKEEFFKVMTEKSID